MTDLERKQMVIYIENYRKALPAFLQTHWNNWIKTRDVVSKKLNLTQDQLLYITKRHIIGLVVGTLREGSGFNKLGPTKFAKIKGNTKLLIKMNELVTTRQSIEKIIPNTIKRFDAEMDKQNKKSR